MGDIKTCPLGEAYMLPQRITLRLGRVPAALFALLAGSACSIFGHELSVNAASSTDVEVQHVFIVMLENHSYSNVIGNAGMPYLNGLAKKYAYAESYYANTHPSIGNYFELTTGQIITNDDGYSQTVTEDNIVRHLIAAGKTWKEYSEGLPYPGYTGGDSGEYTEHHNPLSYFSDVRSSTTQQGNLVPFTQFSSDLANHSLPQYSFIVPDDDDNGHDCPDAIPSCTDDQRLAAVDNWLNTNINPLILSPDFTAAHGLLVIVFDESVSTDSASGGGHVAWIVVGPDVKNGHVSTTFYQHPSTLRFMSQSIGLTSFPGAAATAPDMGEFLSSADLFLRIWPSTTTLHQGDLLTYVFPVWNRGPDDAVHEVLNTQVPAGTTFDYILLSGTPGLGTCTHPAYQGTGQVVCHENSSMAPNTTWTVRLTVKVTAPSGTVITENAAAMADTLDPNLANNTATASLTVQ